MQNLPNLGGLGAIKMGPGVVGRSTVVVVAMLGFCSVVAWAVKDTLWAILLVFFVGIIATMAALYAAFAFANKFPNHAIMEGGQFVDFTKLTQSAKDPTIIDADTPLTDNKPPTALIPDGDR